MSASSFAAASRFCPAAWSLESFAVVSRMREYFPQGTTAKYPLRFLRYWFVRHLLEAHSRKLGRPINVLEVGVDRGQMLTFMGAAQENTLPSIAARWDAVDVASDPDVLAARGYTDYIVFNVEGGARPSLTRRYDAIIFLHLLEHLRAPEACLRAFLPFLQSDGIMTGGSPTMPKFVADAGYEKHLADRAIPFGHVSVLSPERLESFAMSERLEIAFLSGAFFMRTGGSWIENYATWLRLNVAFGSLFPSLGSELYFSLSREAPLRSGEGANLESCATAR
jgi:methyltransferase family protein